jgi:hypothetical protein
VVDPTEPGCSRDICFVLEEEKNPKKIQTLLKILLFWKKAISEHLVLFAATLPNAA